MFPSDKPMRKSDNVFQKKYKILELKYGIFFRTKMLADSNPKSCSN